MRYPRTAGFNERLFAAVLPWLPVWLIYFSQSRLGEAGLPAAWERWPVLAALAAIFLTGLYVRFIAIQGAKAFHARPRSHFRLFDVPLVWLKTSGRAVFYSTLWLTLIPALALQAVVLPNRVFTPGNCSPHPAGSRSVRRLVFRG